MDSPGRQKYLKEMYDGKDTIESIIEHSCGLYHTVSSEADHRDVVACAIEKARWVQQPHITIEKGAGINQRDKVTISLGAYTCSFCPQDMHYLEPEFWALYVTPSCMAITAYFQRTLKEEFKKLFPNLPVPEGDGL